MDRMNALTGYAGWVRVGPEYRTDGNYNSYAAVLWNAHARGMKVLLTGLGSFNGGAHSMPLVGNASQQTAYINYMEALLRIGADAVSPWNEPNNPIFGGPNPTWQQDSALQADLAWAIAVVGWHGTVFSSGLSPHGDLVGQPNDPLIPYNWWMNLLQGDTSWASRFTVLDAHAYAWSNNGTLKTTPERYNTALQQAKMQDVIAFVGGGWKPLAWTEYGAPSQGDTAAGQPGPINATQQTQNANYVDAHTLWKEWEAAGRPLWGKLAHKDNDDPSDRDPHGAAYNFGLIDGNGNIRLAAGTFQSEATRVR